ncbi:MAG TPA: homocysteine S-methyltransferase family protein [Euzebyales bacterium]|nr:homocysteine S-methyltransferase family protein [Euzebyales bacterium]
MTEILTDDEILLLDGGIGMQLVARGVATSDQLWAARALIEQPEIVSAVHDAYLAAGADVITTNTYSTALPRMERAGVAQRFRELNELAAQLAVQARDAHGRDVLIAGSLPPLGGSYRPDEVGDDLWMVDNYRMQAEVLAPFVDVLLPETLSSSREARAAASAAVSVGRPVWIGLTVGDDGRLRGGETVAEAVGGLRVDGVFANCATPEAITAAMPEIVTAPAAYVGGYANAFAQVPRDWEVTQGLDRLGSRSDIDPDAYATIVSDWLDGSANVVGGCCGIGPDHIATLRELIDGRTSAG